jgi:hypothetical protein
LGVKMRRFGVIVGSAVETTGAATTRVGAMSADCGSDTAPTKIGGCEGITMCSCSCALKCKLQPLECLTLIGTESRCIRRITDTGRTERTKESYGARIKEIDSGHPE